MVPAICGLAVGPVYLSCRLDALADKDDDKDPGQKEAQTQMPAHTPQVGHVMLWAHGQ